VRCKKIPGDILNKRESSVPSEKEVEAAARVWMRHHQFLRLEDCLVASAEALAAAEAVRNEGAKFKLGDRVQKKRGSSWHGPVVGWYSTELTPEGYAVQSEREPGSVQVYPADALEPSIE
jgi:hypothetical protein